MDTRKLEIFLAVTQSGSFSVAAERLYITQAAVSQHMAKLEAHLGTTLFVRGRRGVRLTASGEVLRGYAEQILNLLREAENAVLETGEAVRGQLRVGASVSVGAYLLPDWMGAFRARHPQGTLSLTTDITPSIQTALLDQRLDLAYVEGELTPTPHLEKRLLHHVPQVAVVAADYAPLQGRNVVNWSDLADCAFIMRPPASHARQWLERLLHTQGLNPRIIAEFDSPESIKQAVMAGVGVAVLPDYAVRRELNYGLLSALPLAQGLTRPLMLVWDKRRALSGTARAFLNLTLG